MKQLPGHRYSRVRIIPHGQTEELTGTLAHLPALAAKAPHALLLPLGTHAAENAEHEVELLVLLDAVSGEGALNKLVITVQETDHVGRDELLVLDLSLKLRNEGGRLDLVGPLADDDLHGSDFFFLLGCSNLRGGEAEGDVNSASKQYRTCVPLLLA